MNFIKKKLVSSFTLIELVIVLAIFTLLAISVVLIVTRWVIKSKDVRRLSDLNTITRSLTIHKVEDNRVPYPSWEIWTWVIETKSWRKDFSYVWTFWNDTVRELDSITKIPLDPEWNEYMYWISTNRTEFEVAATLEWYWESAFISSKVFADKNDTIVKAKVLWNYKPKSVILTWDVLRIIPSLLFIVNYNDRPKEIPYDLWRIWEEWAYFVVDQWKNLPYRYNWEENKWEENQDKSLARALWKEEARFEWVELSEVFSWDTKDLLRDLYQATWWSEDETKNIIKMLKKEWYLEDDDIGENEIEEEIEEVVKEIQEIESNWWEFVLKETWCWTRNHNWYSLDRLEEWQVQSFTKNISNWRWSIEVKCENWEINIWEENISCNENYVLHQWGCHANVCNWTAPLNTIKSNWEMENLVWVNWTYNETPGTCTFVCKDNYYRDWTTCQENTRDRNCTWLPNNSQWNTVSNITQTWNWLSWEPTTTSIYDVAESTVGCRYKCVEWYQYNSEYWVCVQIISWDGDWYKDITYYSDMWNIAYSKMNDESTIKKWTYWSNSTRNSWIIADLWVPRNINRIRYGWYWRRRWSDLWYWWENTELQYSMDWSTRTKQSTLPANYSISYMKNYYFPSITARYLKLYRPSWRLRTWQFRVWYFEWCEENYDWNWSICVAKSKLVNCEWLPDNSMWIWVTSITQKWDWAIWSPSNVWIYWKEENTSWCVFRCNIWYAYNWTECVDETQSVYTVTDRNLRNDSMPSWLKDWEWHTITIKYSQSHVTRPNWCSTTARNWNYFKEWNRCTRDSKVWWTAFTHWIIPSNCTEWCDIQWRYVECPWNCNGYGRSWGQVRKIWWWCVWNYVWDWETCAAGTKETNCIWLPENAEWNWISKLTQTRNWKKWLPSVVWTYSETPWITECKYKCSEWYYYNPWTNTCVDRGDAYLVTNPNAQNQQMPDWMKDWEWHTVIVKYSQAHWRANSWWCSTTSRNWNYNYNWNRCTRDSWIWWTAYIHWVIWSDCTDWCAFEWRYVSCPWNCNWRWHYWWQVRKAGNYCIENYTWDWETCQPNTQEVACEWLPENAEWNSVWTITQTWNWSKWVPTSSEWVYNTNSSTTECRFKCNDEYYYSTSSENCLKIWDITPWRQENIDYYSDNWNNYSASCYQPTFENMNDEDVSWKNAYWSPWTSNSRIRIDMKYERSVNRIRYWWRGCRWGSNWRWNWVKLQYSNDWSNWIEIASMPNNYSSSSMNDYSFTTITARYIRLYQASWRLRTWQFRVWYF